MDSFYIIITILASLIALLALPLGAYGITRIWKKRFEAQVNKTFEQKKQKKAFESIRTQAKNYLPEDPEPYGAIAQKLHTVLEQSEDTRLSHTQELRHMYRYLPNYPPYDSWEFWLAFWRPLFRWWQFYKRVESVADYVLRIEQQHTLATDIFEDLQNLPHRTATWAKKVATVNQQVCNLNQRLNQYGFCGNAVDKMTQAVNTLDKTLRNLPPHFFQDDPDLIVNQSNKKNVIHTWQILNDIESPLQENLQTLNTWQELYQNVGTVLSEMKKALQTLEERLSLVRPFVEIGDFDHSYKQIHEQFQNCVTLYKRPRVTLLQELAQDIPIGLRKVTTLTGKANSLDEKRAQLSDVIIANSQQLTKAANLMNEVSQVKIYPVNWQASIENLAHLCKIEEHIGQVETKRSQSDLSRHLVMGNELQESTRQLIETINTSREMRDSLIPLLEHPLVLEESTWLNRARKFETLIYAPENWNKADAVWQVSANAQHLASYRLTHLGAYLNQELPEAILKKQFVDETQTFIADLEAFSQRLARIEARLHILQETEEGAYTTLDTYHPVIQGFIGQLSQIDLRLLSGKSLPTDQRSLFNLQEEAYRLYEMLEQQKVGQVDLKANEVDSWATYCRDKILPRFQKSLLTELSELKAVLDEEVNALQEIAPFDEERAMYNAQKLLRAYKNAPLQGEGHTIAFETFVANVNEQLLTLNKFQKAYVAILQQITKVIEPRYQDLQAYQEETQDLFTYLEELANGTTQSTLLGDIDRIESLITEANYELDSLKNVGHDVNIVRDYLDDLIQQYELASMEANDMVKKLEQEQHVTQVRE